MFFYLQVDLNATIRGFIWAVCMQVREVKKKSEIWLHKNDQKFQ